MRHHGYVCFADGKKNHLIQLDCRSLEYNYIPLELNGYKIVLFNTNVKHSLASSAYNKRREECAAGVQLVQQHHPHIQSLRDVTEAMLDGHVQGSLRPRAVPVTRKGFTPTGGRGYFV